MKIKDRSLYMRLRSIKQMDKFESFAKEIIAEPTEIHPVISQFMADIMAKSSYISPNLAIEFIIKVGDKAFYTNYRKSSGFRFNTEGLIRLLSVAVPDEAIEARLGEMLYERLNAKDWVRTIQILKALKDYGSLTCLPVLEVLDYDFSVEFQVAKVKSNLMVAPNSLTTNSDLYFEAWASNINSKVVIKVAKLLKETIKNIKARDHHPQYLIY